MSSFVVSLSLSETFLKSLSGMMGIRCNNSCIRSLISVSVTLFGFLELLPLVVEEAVESLVLLAVLLFFLTFFEGKVAADMADPVAADVKDVVVVSSLAFFVRVVVVVVVMSCCCDGDVEAVSFTTVSGLLGDDRLAVAVTVDDLVPLSSATVLEDTLAMIRLMFEWKRMERR